MNFDQKQLLHKKIEAGCALITNKTIVHTAPHHDDIVLSYHAYAMRNMDGNRNHFVYATSGFNGVTDAFVIKLAQQVDTVIIAVARGYSYQEVLQLFAKAYRDENHEQMDLYKKFIFVQSIAQIFACADEQAVISAVEWIRLYFSAKKPGQKDIEVIQQLKGRIRESESDCKWMISKGDIENITHFQSSFYTADQYAIEAAMESDVQRLFDYFIRVQPDIITVALDPCGIGPKNHYATLQMIAAAVARLDNRHIKIIGYRNVWSSFLLDEASMIAPVTKYDIDTMESIFLHCFTTQTGTIFVGTESDGPFSTQVKYIQDVQWQQIQTMLDNDFIADHQYEIVRNAVGAIFLKELTIQELLLLAGFDHQF